MALTLNQQPNGGWYSNKKINKKKKKKKQLVIDHVAIIYHGVESWEVNKENLFEFRVRSRSLLGYQYFFYFYNIQQFKK